jgi:hypothetical protein
MMPLDLKAHRQAPCHDSVNAAVERMSYQKPVSAIAAMTAAEVFGLGSRRRRALASQIIAGMAAKSE